MSKTDDILKNLKKIKTLPHVAIKLTQVISNDSCTVRDLEDIIKLDPTLIIRLLRLINSPYYGLYNKVESISDAVIYIGLENLRNMIVVEAVKDIFKESLNDSEFSGKKLWFHCAVVGICCQMIAERIFSIKSEDSFLCGILHDIGLIIEYQVESKLLCDVLDQYDPDKNNLCAIEKKILGTDHCKLGCAITKEWKLPLDVQLGIKTHHTIVENVNPASIQGIIQIAEYLAIRLNHKAVPGMKAILSQSLMVHMKNNIDEYKTIIIDLPEEIDKAKEMYQ
jgi:HD-like signal output (HDOD) protein